MNDMKLTDIIFEKADLKTQIKKLVDKTDNPEILNKVKSSFMKDLLDAEFESDYVKDAGSDKDRDLYKRAISIFRQLGATTEEQFFVAKQILKNPKFQIDGNTFKRTFVGKTEDIVPSAVRNKQMYANLIKMAMNVTKSGSDAIGPGEVALTLLGKDAKQVKGSAGGGGDIDFGGWGVEVKAGTAAIHAYNNDASIDREVQRFTELNSIPHDFDYMWDRDNPLNDIFKKDKKQFQRFLESIYGSAAKSIASKVYSLLGTPQFNNTMGPWILSEYLEKSKSDCLLIFTTNGDRFANIVKGDTKLPEGIKFKINSVRRSQASRAAGKKGNTLAYPDGYSQIVYK